MSGDKGGTRSQKHKYSLLNTFHIVWCVNSEVWKHSELSGKTRGNQAWLVFHSLILSGAKCRVRLGRNNFLCFRFLPSSIGVIAAIVFVAPRPCVPHPSPRTPGSPPGLHPLSTRGVGWGGAAKTRAKKDLIDMHSGRVWTVEARQASEF